MENKMFRQGDVLLREVTKLPNGLVEKNKILAYGEATGHHHRFESVQVQVFKDDNGKQFVEVKEPSKLVHEEHAELEIPKGTYVVVTQREFDVIQGIRQVID
jgi:hypothetical protein